MAEAMSALTHTQLFLLPLFSVASALSLPQWNGLTSAWLALQLHFVPGSFTSLLFIVVKHMLHKIYDLYHFKVYSAAV